MGRLPDGVALDSWVLEKGGRIGREKLELGREAQGKGQGSWGLWRIGAWGLGSGCVLRWNTWAGSVFSLTVGDGNEGDSWDNPSEFW